MWWAVATLTTVGYGDVYPTTPLGRFLGALTAVVGIGMFALPTAIIGSGFVEELQKFNDPDFVEFVRKQSGGILLDTINKTFGSTDNMKSKYDSEGGKE